MDWLRVTIPYQYDENDKISNYLSNNNNPMTAYRVSTTSTKSLIYAVINVLGLDGQNYTDASISSLTKLERANFGYTGTFVLGHARIMYKQARKYMPLSSIKMGICLELSSHALRDIEQTDGFKNWITFFQTIQTYFPDARFTRIDLACDFMKDMKRLSAEGLHRLLKDKKVKFVTTSRSAPRYQGEVHGHKDCAETVYINRPKSRYMLRVYNKYYERLNEHGDAWLKHNRIKHWTRYELEIHERIASHVIGLLRSGVSASQIWLDLIRKLMYIQASSDDVKKGRVKSIETQVFDVKNKIYKTKVVIVPKFWAEFIDNSNVPKFDYTGKTPSWTYDKHMHWFGSAVMPSFTKDLLAQIMQGCDVNTYLNQIFSQSLSKLQPADVDDIIHWAKSLKVSKFKQAKNEFDFTSMLKSMSDRFTGMIGQRLYDLRNKNRFTEDDLITHEIEEYENFVKEYGLANEIVRLKQKGIIQ